MKPDSVLISFVRTLEQTPRYLFEYFLGLLTAVLVDPTVTSLAIGCTLLGCLAAPLVGLSSFFLIYTVLRTINSIANAIGGTGRYLATTINSFLARMLVPSSPPDTSDSPPT